MTITLDPEHEQVIEKAMRAGAYRNPEEIIGQALEMFQSQEHRLAANREAINSKILRGIDELEREEGITEDLLDAHLQQLKSQTE